MVLILALAGMLVDGASGVRSSSSTMAALIEQARVTSPTFADLVDELHASDVVVYVEWSVRPRAGFIGETMHRVVLGPGTRYLWVVIDPRYTRARLVATIAHELQHAVEIARATDVRDEDGVVQLFERIGFRCSGRSYETMAARDMEGRVLAEISRKPSMKGR